MEGRSLVAASCILHYIGETSRIEKSAAPEKNERVLLKFLAILDILPFADYAVIEYGKMCAYL